jgi:predicted O-methyltransferase YrrM
LAEGLQKNGVLHTIDINEELFDFQRKYFEKSEYGKLIHQHLGDALDVVPKLDMVFDLVFIDADKENYAHYFNLIIEKVNSGGIILSDNVLWSGKVIEPLQPDDLETKTLIEYNALLKEDKRIETVMLPIRDGLTISRKK